MSTHLQTKFCFFIALELLLQYQATGTDLHWQCFCRSSAYLLKYIAQTNAAELGAGLPQTLCWEQLQECVSASLINIYLNYFCVAWTISPIIAANRCFRLHPSSIPARCLAIVTLEALSTHAVKSKWIFGTKIRVILTISINWFRFGGECKCKPNIIGRRCDRCAPGHHSFPDCLRKLLAKIWSLKKLRIRCWIISKTENYKFIVNTRRTKTNWPNNI